MTNERPADFFLKEARPEMKSDLWNLLNPALPPMNGVPRHKFEFPSR